MASDTPWEALPGPLGVQHQVTQVGEYLSSPVEDGFAQVDDGVDPIHGSLAQQRHFEQKISFWKRKKFFLVPYVSQFGKNKI